ncbi:SNase-domain-containing protein [Myriangium duriaei CBS 260.36]|uniref:Probable endonuclease LCL3 n=1 Tax=Myriangium duriaei CBS 260.36 TaxID=1168546 RepID=A0A9P4J390_9PEZI|nr:SNase-domain-containing protein [Myriangium duriaei CBS 260.36]
MPWTDWLWQRSPSPTPSKDNLPDTISQSLPELDPSTISDLSTSPIATIVLPSLALTTTTLLGIRFYKHNLRRIPTAPFIPPRVFRRRSLYGYVTSVGDGDNFRLFHTPGGRLAGWGILPFRRHHLPLPPSARPNTPPPSPPQKLDTIHVRIAGVDAPELAHFGRPAQPYGAEALTFLRGLVLHRPVRVYLYRRDQYERVVGTAWRKVDVGLAMIREGMATVYEAKFGSEFGGKEKEALYRAAEKEAKARKKGMWGSGKSGAARKNKLESPREYKNRMRDLEEGKGGDKGKK